MWIIASGLSWAWQPQVGSGVLASESMPMFLLMQVVSDMGLPAVIKLRHPMYVSGRPLQPTPGGSRSHSWIGRIPGRGGCWPAGAAASDDGGARMIPVLRHGRMWLANGHSDMCWDVSGLALQVQQALSRDPHGGDLYVFRDRRNDRHKMGVQLLMGFLGRVDKAFPLFDRGQLGEAEKVACGMVVSCGPAPS